MEIRPHGGTGIDRRRYAEEDAVSADAVAIERAERPDDRGLSPVILGYAAGPLALVLVAVFLHFGLVARLPLWSYVAVVGVTLALSMAVEGWREEPAGSIKLHARLGLHVLAVTVAIYMTGWGPVLGMAYAFVALEELQQCGAAMWRGVMCWSLVCIAVAQVLVWRGVAPSFLKPVDAEAIGALGAFVLAIVIRMAGATGAEKEQAEYRLTHQALHDMLTDLPNRAYFYEWTDEALEELPASATAVLLFDLDRFKEINDTLGHQFGDRLLVEVGPRARAVLRARDLLARLGGDEFCVLLPDIDDLDAAVRVAQRIVAVLEEPFEIEGVTLGVEASCGIAVAPKDGTTADQLLQRADVAMYVAKEAKANVVVYSDEFDVNTPARLALLGDLRTALGRDEFVLHFQPTASMRTWEVCGAEALIRWQHPTRGLLYPDRFIAEAERSGLIEPMTVWVLDAALQQCRAWLDVAGRPWDPTAVGGREPFDPEPARRRPCRGRSVRHSTAGASHPGCSSWRSPRRSSWRDPGRAQRVLDRIGRHGRGAGHRRLRHGLLLACLPPRAPGDRAQDRSFVRGRHGSRRRRRSDRSFGHRPGSKPRPSHRGRRGRRRADLVHPHRARLRQGPGLRPGPADDRRGLHPVAYPSGCRRPAGLGGASVGGASAGQRTLVDGTDPVAGTSPSS